MILTSVWRLLVLLKAFAWLGLFCAASNCFWHSSCMECVNDPCSRVGDRSNPSQHCVFCAKGEVHGCVPANVSDNHCESVMYTTRDCEKLQGALSVWPVIQDESDEGEPINYLDCKSGQLKANGYFVEKLNKRTDAIGDTYGPGRGNALGASYQVFVNLCHNVTSVSESCATKSTPFLAERDDDEEENPWNPCIDIKRNFWPSFPLIPVILNNPNNITDGYNVSLGAVACCSGEKSAYVNLTVSYVSYGCKQQNATSKVLQVPLEYIGNCSAKSELVVVVGSSQLCSDALAREPQSLSRSKIIAIALSVVATALFVGVSSLFIWKKIRSENIPNRHDQDTTKLLDNTHQSQFDHNSQNYSSTVSVHTVGQSTNSLKSHGTQKSKSTCNDAHRSQFGHNSQTYSLTASGRSVGQPADSWKSHNIQKSDSPYPASEDAITRDTINDEVPVMQQQ